MGSRHRWISLDIHTTNMYKYVYVYIHILYKQIWGLNIPHCNLCKLYVNLAVVSQSIRILTILPMFEL